MACGQQQQKSAEWVHSGNSARLDRSRAERYK
jgi:hypothetical protein